MASRHGVMSLPPREIVTRPIPPSCARMMFSAASSWVPDGYGDPSATESAVAQPTSSITAEVVAPGQPEVDQRQRIGTRGTALGDLLREAVRAADGFGLESRGVGIAERQVEGTGFDSGRIDSKWSGVAAPAPPGRTP